MPQETKSRVQSQEPLKFRSFFLDSKKTDNPMKTQSQRGKFCFCHLSDGGLVSRIYKDCNKPSENTNAQIKTRTKGTKHTVLQRSQNSQCFNKCSTSLATRHVQSGWLPAKETYTDKKGDLIRSLSVREVSWRSCCGSQCGSFSKA